MDFNYKFEDWEYKILEAFYDNPNNYFNKLISDTVLQYKNTCIDRYVNYCKENNLPISYNSDNELVQKLYNLNLVTNLNQLNKKFLESN